MVVVVSVLVLMLQELKLAIENPVKAILLNCTKSHQQDKNNSNTWVKVFK